MKQQLRIAMLFALACGALAAFSVSAQAQKVDVAFGISTVEAPGASSASGDHVPVSLTGGTYPGFSGDVLFFHHIGIGGEIFWRGSQSDNYLGSGYNYRPVFYDIGAVYSPKLASHTYLELDAGIGALSSRFYTGTSCGPYSCSNYQSSNHFMGVVGGGLKFYPYHSFFIRPEAKLYLVNNNVDYSSWYATRFGASIGYTFGGR